MKKTLSASVAAQLGKVPDRELAYRAGVSPAAIARARRAKGIPAARPGRAWLTPKIRALLGTLSDREVAGRAGVSASAVAHARRQLGIAAFCGCAPPALFGTRRR